MFFFFWPEGTVAYGPMAKPEVRAQLCPRAKNVTYCPQTIKYYFLIHIFYYMDLLLYGFMDLEFFLYILYETFTKHVINHWVASRKQYSHRPHAPPPSTPAFSRHTSHPHPVNRTRYITCSKRLLFTEQLS